MNIEKETNTNQDISIDESYKVNYYYNKNATITLNEILKCEFIRALNLETVIPKIKNEII